MGTTLGAEADNGTHLAAQHCEIGILVRVYSRGHTEASGEATPLHGEVNGMRDCRKCRESIRRDRTPNQGFQPQAFRCCRACFVMTAQFLENAGKYHVFAGPVRLPGDDSTLGVICILKSILIHSHLCDQTERLDVVNVEPAGMPQGCSRLFCLAFFAIKVTESERSFVMPPILAGKVLHYGKRRIRTFGFTEQLGLKANDLPHAGIVMARFFRDPESGSVVILPMTRRREIEHGDPSARVFLTRSFSGFGGGGENIFRFFLAALTHKYFGEIVAGDRVSGLMRRTSRNMPSAFSYSPRLP